MSNRCPDCQKFVSLEVADPEMDDPELDGDSVRVTGRVHLDCAECSTEMKEWQIDLEDSLPKEVLDHLDANDGHEISVEFANDPEVNDSYRARKPPKPHKDGTIPNVPFRYKTHYYDINIDCTITCSCGESWEMSLSDEIQASEMDDLNW